jgi:Septum formation
MDFDYRLPHTEEPEITIRRTAAGRIGLLVDGVAVAGRGGVYAVPDSTGEVHLVKVTGAWTGLRAIADGWDTPVEPAVPMWSRLLILLPLLLVVGGLVGLALGAVAAALNALVGRSSAGIRKRAAVMVLLAAVAAVGWVATGAVLTSVPATRASYATGTCLDGIAPGIDLVSQAPTTVDCSTAHDAEVVGTYNADPAPSYPGESILQTSAAYQCPTLFKSYVGIDFGSSKLDILPVVPTEIAWAAGTREISCLALTTDGSKLTGSVRGTRQ